MPKKRPETKRSKNINWRISASKCTRYSRSSKRPSRRYNGRTFKSRIRLAFTLWIWRKTTIIKYKKWS